VIDSNPTLPSQWCDQHMQDIGLWEVRRGEKTYYICISTVSLESPRAIASLPLNTRILASNLAEIREMKSTFHKVKKTVSSGIEGTSSIVKSATNAVEGIGRSAARHGKSATNTTVDASKSVAHNTKEVVESGGNALSHGVKTTSDHAVAGGKSVSRGSGRFAKRIGSALKKTTKGVKSKLC
jgi:prophage DNA circulation protein